METTFDLTLEALDEIEEWLWEDCQLATKAGLLPSERAAMGHVVDTIDTLGDLVTRLGMRPPGATKSINSTAGDLVTAPGSAVKAVGLGRVEGYLIKYGGKGDLSQWRDVFLKAPGTDYGRRRTSDAWVHHGLLPGLGERMLTNEAQLEEDEVGIFCKLLLDMGDKYESALYQLTAAGKLGWSSGTLPNLVKRQRNADGSHTVKRWILGGDASLTPSPAGGRGMRASVAMKSMLLDLGVDITKSLPRNEPARALLIPGASTGSYCDTNDYWGLKKFGIEL
jgi:hypothetical protein